MNVNQLVITASRESVADLAPCCNNSANSSLVSGLRCLAAFSSFSCPEMITRHIFARSDKSAGIGKFRSWKRVLMLLIYPCTVLDRELWLSIKFSMKQAMILLYPCCLGPQGLVICIDLAQFKETACLNCMVPISESGLDPDIFASTICPKWERAICDSVGRNCRLSAPYVPVRGGHSCK